MKPLVEGQPRTIGRREFVQKLAFTTTTAALSPLVTACLPDSQQSIVRKEKREVRTQPTLSDVIIVNKSAYLLGGDGKRYPLRTEEIDPYIVASKLNEHDRGVFTVPASFLEKYPLGQRREENILVNRSTMLPVENRMGEAVVLFMGMLTNSNDYSGDIGPQSFPQITQSLLSSGWRDSQNLLFTYGNKPSGKSIEQIVRDGGLGYNFTYTLRPLRELSADAISHLEHAQELLPYCQENVVGHSLGGLLALLAMMEHYTSVNTAVLISSPNRGIPKDFVRSQLYEAARNMMSQRLKGDKIMTGAFTLINDLFGLWENKEYQRKLDEFTTAFVKSGRKLIVIIDENDPVVPPESSRLKGATEIRIKGKTGFDLFEALKKVVGPQEGLVEYALALWTAHGNGLRDPKAIQVIKEAFGDNRSFPIGSFKQIPPRFPVKPDFG